MDVRKAKARYGPPGAGRDGFLFVAGFPVANPPDTPPTVVIGFGDLYNVTIPPDQFTFRGKEWVFTGNLQGLQRVIVNYAKERITVKAAGIDLGPSPDGPQPILFIAEIDGDRRGVEVRMVRKGNRLIY